MELEFHLKMSLSQAHIYVRDRGSDHNNFEEISHLIYLTNLQRNSSSILGIRSLFQFIFFSFPMNTKNRSNYSSMKFTNKTSLKSPRLHYDVVPSLLPPLRNKIHKTHLQISFYFNMAKITAKRRRLIPLNYTATSYFSSSSPPTLNRENTLSYIHKFHIYIQNQKMQAVN